MPGRKWPISETFSGIPISSDRLNATPCQQSDGILDGFGSATPPMIIYAHRQKDLIPDFVPDFGHADESAVVRAVLIEHEKVLADYATRHHRNWTRISVKP